MVLPSASTTETTHEASGIPPLLLFLTFELKSEVAWRSNLASAVALGARER